MRGLDSLKRWLEQHARAAIGALGRLARRPAGSLMTTAVVGIALALPGGFLVGLDNLETATDGWDGNPRLSVFLEKDVPEDQQARMADRLRAMDPILGVERIDPDTGLAELREQTGLADSLSLLDDNPLPPVLDARLIEGIGSNATDTLLAEVQSMAGVDEIRLDRLWLERLQALTSLAGRVVTLVALLLGLTVALVVGNTIRLDIANARPEIEITKLIGGTDGFVRRPFLYAGLWYGLAGGVLAALLMSIGVALITGPAGQLAALYDSGFVPAGPGLSGTLALVATGGGLGLLGAWLAVGRHLADIEPGH